VTETPKAPGTSLDRRKSSPVDPSALKDRVDGVLSQDRRQTDESLRTERHVTDNAVEASIEQQADEVLARERDRIDERVQQSRDVRDERTRASADVLPEVADTLEHAAGNLASVAEDLTDAARSLKGVPVPSAAGPNRAAGDSSERPPRPFISPEVGTDVVTTLGNIAESLAGVAGEGSKEESSPRDVPPEAAAPAVVEGLADVAESLADVVERVADERESADESVQEERVLLDHALDHERLRSDETIDAERHARRVLLAAERRRTDRHLVDEREDTDRAVEHALALMIEEQARRAHAENRVVSRDEFLAIVSHDLRSPLDVIAINAALLAQHAPGDETGAKLKKWARNISRAAGVMDRLLSDLLDVARFEGGEFRITTEVRDVLGVVKESVEAFAPLAAACGLSIDVESPVATTHAAYDYDRILQVLSNLLRNAIQFTPAGGSIVIALTPEPDGCRIAVSDTGRGIPDSQLDRIFERFQQLKVADRRGLGLGLYISKRIIDAHGGRIRVESQVGRGTTFSFTLKKGATGRS
jgi:signal transduction histidine kinase